MGLGFRLNLKLGFSVHSHYASNSPSTVFPSSPSSSSVRGRDAILNQTRLSFQSVVSEESDIAFKDSFKPYAYSSAVQTIETEQSQVEGFKVNVGKKSHRGLNVIDHHLEDEASVSSSSLRQTSSRYSLLLENLNTLEQSFSDSDVLKLEKDILLQLGRLGALKLFNACLSGTHETTNALELSDVPSERECKIIDASFGHPHEVVVRSTRKEERKSRRERASAKSDCEPPTAIHPLQSIQNGPGKSTLSSGRRASNSKCRRLMIARNEAEMARGVKVLADLERVRITLEEESGRAISLSCWAEAAQLDVKVLQQQLSFGWYCRDELIKSTRSLVLYFARNYRGMGIALEDLLQAGNLGVLQGAERFDHTRGYRFSTYVQYWIRKSMSKIVSRHARGIQIPCALSRAINQIKKAQKALSTSNGKYPDDTEIAKFTGLSLAKIESASRCLRVVGSIDQKIGDSLSAKYLEFLPDTSVECPEEAVMRQHMIQDIHNLLKGLDSRERQVLVLRFGLKDYQPKSLEEIGRHFHVSKEWVRRLEKRVMTRLRDEKTYSKLRHYINS